jgi:uncharacterized membrane protein HdeD (DUF308 family)
MNMQVNNICETLVENIFHHLFYYLHKKMKKQIPIYLYGSLIIIAGFSLLFSEDVTFNVIKFTLGITLVTGAIFAFITAISRQRKQVQFAYHEMHALAMLVYGLSILVFCDSYEKLISFTAFLCFFYAISEIVFGNWLYNLYQKTINKIVLIRVFFGFVIGIGTVIAMNYSEITLKIFGALIILIGTNVMLYVPVMKASQSSDIDK